MRISHAMFVVSLAAIAFAVAREPAGRVALVVFVVGLAAIAACLTALMTLFRTFGSLGTARRPIEFATAIAASGGVLLIAAVLINGLLWVGIAMVSKVV